MAAGSIKGEGSDARGLNRAQVYGLVALLLALSNVPLAFLIWLWPDLNDLGAVRTVMLLGLAVTISPEQRVLLIVAFCGLLGGSIRLLLRIRNEFSVYRVSGRYVPWYFLTPPIGAILAVGFYFAVRGGFFANTTSVRDVNIFAFAATGVLVGLFAEASVARLEGAFVGAFSTQASRDERANPSAGSIDASNSNQSSREQQDGGSH
jgi:hypothetical protein